MRRRPGKKTASRRGLTARRFIHTGNFQGRKTDTPLPSNDILLLKHAQPVNTLTKSKPEFENIRFSACESMSKESIMICGNKMSTRCNRGFYCRSYCLLNMFRAPLCPSSGAQEYYTVVAACGIMCPVCRMLQRPANRTHNPQLHTRPTT